MKKSIQIVFLFLVANFSFGQINFGKPEVNPDAIQLNFLDWNVYQINNIMLSRDFIALDAAANVISKETFLNELALGNYFPIKLLTKDATIYYQLFKINAKSDTSIKATIMQTAFDEKKNFEMEGKLFPEFSCKDLNGNLITNNSMKGKIVVIKCWYIHCAACIREFPKVNNLVENYKNRNDIIFLSLAEDTPEQLDIFLNKKPLSYLVVPNMKIYMNEVLQLNAFPTHFIVDKEGRILKVLSNFESLEVALEKICAD
ncbi:TlpA disulfide reductase family protein [Flavobacterium sp. SUN052]|uniref:TlpA family protein disulfide reductase n=1 Tax=Flavobacterium sp. SUN052 TaxID=3002441 RepID=UPI00237E2374|nr:TlpA disulfide reductase family protein [Flavobacterium sp. SUN052]MEC4005857.1 TlpA disulfide reductase family protein [Flavobacterium sp. SUN052]